MTNYPTSCGLFVAALLMSGCMSWLPSSDPMEDVTLLSDVVEAETESANLVAAPPPDGGLLAGLFAALGEASPEVTDAGLTTNAPPAEGGGLLGLFSGRGLRLGPTPADNVAPGTILEFGKLGVTCALPRAERGSEIASAGGFKIYDSDPSSTAPRPHYITGFDDGCARQFTAALVMTGDVGTHELVRYSQTRVTLEYSATDDAYEAIKSSFCRAGFGEPCGARLERLGARTTFVTAYKSFGASPQWAEFLLHDGAVAASDLEGL